MRMLLLSWLIFLSYCTVEAQGPPHFEQIQNADTLDFELVQKRHTRKSSCRTIIEGEPRFDFQNQYPYYQLPFPQVIGDSIELVFKHLPKTGYVYVYSIDPQNSPVLYKNVPYKIKEIKPGDKFFVSEVFLQGPHHFCVLYAHAPIKDPERFFEAMELTQGTFLFRQHAMYGNKLLPPQRAWQLKPDGFGVYFNQQIFQGIDDGKILVYLEMPAQGKYERD